MRYVLLRHECPADYRDGPHWDLMLEAGDALRTWSLLELPLAWGGANDSVAAEQLPRHRLAYLDYEGEVSRGRGNVSRVARGEYAVVAEEASKLVVRALSGELSGEWTLTHDSQKRPERWALTAIR